MLDGPGIELPERAVVPLGLVLHELTTNAVKYGAWSKPGGMLTVRWRCPDGRLVLDWEEQGGEPPSAGSGEPAHRGFGSALIDGSARQLGGTIERRFKPEGVKVRIDLPLGE